MDNREHQILHSWNENAAAWTESVRSESIESRQVATNKAIIDAILKHNPTNALDVGCGEGWLARELFNRGIDATGTDGAAPLIEKAEALGGGTFHVLAYEEFSATTPISSIEYDAIVCNFALVGQNVSELLISLRKQLSSKGKLFIQTVHPFAVCGDEPYRDAWRTESFSNFGPGYKEPMPWYFRTVGSWLTLLQTAGFSIDECHEPIHPATGKPLSLLLTCSVRVAV